MKAQLKKDYRNPKLYRWILIYAIYALFCVIGGIILNELLNIAIWLAVPLGGLYAVVFMPYSITETNNLQGGSGIIPIHYITQIHQTGQPHKGLTVYYLIQAGKEQKRNFYPQDEQRFIVILKEINPNILIQLI